MSINELFENENNAESTNTRTLSGTAALTAVSNEAATMAIRKMEADIDNYRGRIAVSAKDNAELDKLLDELAPLVDIEDDSPLRHLDDELVESMLKSQQSKRSRCKSKAMTLDNYRNLLSAAIAENILRDLYNKPKQAGGVKRHGTVDFTPAQLEALGIEVPKANAFEKTENYREYYSINMTGEVVSDQDFGDGFALKRFRAANYCTDKTLMEQSALHEILNRRLWRFSMLHNGDKINWDDYSNKHYIFYARKNNKYYVDYNNEYQTTSTIYFYSKEITQRAIDEIIKPFITEHPDFKW